MAEQMAATQWDSLYFAFGQGDAFVLLGLSRKEGAGWAWVVRYRQARMGEWVPVADSGGGDDGNLDSEGAPPL